MVGISGVEPERPKAPDFESGASTNSAISPFLKTYYTLLIFVIKA